MNKSINHKQTVELMIMIYKKSRNTKMEFRSVSQLNEAVIKLASILNLSRIQAVLFSIIFYCNLNYDSVVIKRILEHLELTILDFFTIKSDFEKLLEIGFIEQKQEWGKNNLYNSSLIVNQKVLDAIFNNNYISDALNSPDLSFIQFCGVINTKIGELVRNRRDSLVILIEFVEKLEKKNSKFSQIQNLKDLKVEILERILLYYLTNEFANNNSDVKLRTMLVQIFGSNNYLKIAHDFLSNQQDLQEKGLVTVNSLGFIEDATISLTENGVSILLEDSKLFFDDVKYKTNHIIIKSQSINKKELFFNEKQNQEIQFFKDSIREENLKKLKDKLSNANIQKSIIAIFEGIPGSGKTEVAKQIARELNYDLFVLDFTRMKSEFYSQSQKLVKESFNEFRRIAQANQNRMILLLNEADGLLHHRINTKSNHSTDETESQIQNILLEEFEKDDYLMILTTNLLEKIDTAFFRRFLFKIKFEYPDKDCIKKIYKSKLDWLTEEQLKELSLIQLSGGQIDNVCMKTILYEVLNLEKPHTNLIREYCLEEKLAKDKQNKIGF